MTIFDDEARRMADEAGREMQSDAARADQLNTIARNISQELLTRLIQHPTGEDIDVGVRENIVRATGRTSRRTLEITCEGPDSFQVEDRNGGFQTQVMAQPPRPI